MLYRPNSYVANLQEWRNRNTPTPRKRAFGPCECLIVLTLEGKAINRWFGENLDHVCVHNQDVAA